MILECDCNSVLGVTKENRQIRSFLWLSLVFEKDLFCPVLFFSVLFCSFLFFISFFLFLSFSFFFSFFLSYWPGLFQGELQSSLPQASFASFLSISIPSFPSSPSFPQMDRFLCHVLGSSGSTR
jgi:hypothetical protein